LQKQQKIDRLEEELRRVKAKLRYQERTAREGPFGASTPSSKITIKANSLEEHQARKGGAKPGHRGYGRRVAPPEQIHRTLSAHLPACCPDCGTELQHRGRRRRTVLDAVLLSGAVAMTFLAGHGQISLYVTLMATAYGLYRVAGLLRIEGRTESIRLAALVAGGLLAGASLAAAQLLPTLEFGRINYRTGAIPYESLIGIKPAQLMTLLVPDAFGNPADYTDEVGRQMGLGVNHFIEGCAYPSCVLAALALVGLSASRRPERWFLAGAACVAALLAIGSPLNQLTYRLVPGMNQMPNLGRALCVACLAIPVLGAMGLEAALAEAEPPARRRTRRTLLAALALVAVVGLRCLLPIVMDSETAGFPR